MGISRVFVANRGEIAVRIIRACQALNIETVVGVSEADRDTLAAKLADRAVCIGPPHSKGSYLNVNALITAAKGTGADAVHPGYGFLAEDGNFAEVCHKNDLIFVGPSIQNLRRMGNKLESRTLARQVGVPVIEGSARIENFQGAGKVADEIGYPVLLKSAAGGGGRGIRIIREKGVLKAEFESASAEAKEAFGDKTLFMERFIENARHIEVQILGDRFGNVVHLGERDCSLQRRYQKMVEETPACGLSERLRRQIQQAAVALAKSIRYRSAGTVEFIVDMDREAFYFLEMNTRLQVEHPVTEKVTGRDIVAAQLRIADGNDIGFAQEEVEFSGCAIECRINAESAVLGFNPSPGRITKWMPPQGRGIRLDTHCFEGYTVPPYYDSLIAKLILHATDRDNAIQSMQRALEAFKIEGIETTVPFLEFVLAQSEYRNCSVTTRWLEKVAEEFMNQHKE